jgi:hypothetical protein
MTGAVIRIAAITLIVCFFLPWGTVSCQGQELGTFSGREFASGAESDAVGPFSSDREGEPEIWFVLFSGFAVLILSLMVWRRWIDRPFAGIAIIVFAAISLVILVANYLDVRDEVERAQGTIQVRYGAVGTVIALLVIIVATIIDVIDRYRAPRRPPP